MKEMKLLWSEIRVSCRFSFFFSACVFGEQLRLAGVGPTQQERQSVLDFWVLCPLEGVLNFFESDIQTRTCRTLVAKCCAMRALQKRWKMFDRKRCLWDQNTHLPTTQSSETISTYL